MPTKSLIIVLLCLCCKPLWAAWQVEMKNLPQPPYNLRFSLSNTESDTLNVEVLLGIKPEDYPAYLVQKKFRMTSSLIQQPYKLEEGGYELHVQIYNPRSDKSEYLRLRFHADAYSPAAKRYFSDLFVSAQPLGTPADHSTSPKSFRIGTQKALHFVQYLQTDLPTLSQRAILYQELPTPVAALSTQAVGFTSIGQFNKVWEFSKGSGNLKGAFDISDLKAGNYLLEVLVFADATLLSERSMQFEITEEPFFLQADQLRESVMQLGIIIGSEQAAQLLKNTPENALKRSLQAKWEALYPTNPLKEAAAFYARVKQAATLFPEGWKSRKCMAYLRYGEPDEKKHFQTAQGEVEVWLYHKWQLPLLFL